MVNWKKDMDEDIKKKDNWVKVETPKRKIYPSKSQQISDFQKQKSASIQDFTDIKNFSIKMSGASRDATLLVTTFYPEFIVNSMEDANSKEEALRKVKIKKDAIKVEWQSWRDWIFFQTDLPASEMMKRNPPF